MGPGEASNVFLLTPEIPLDPTHMLEITKLILCRQEPNGSHDGVANSGSGATVSQVSRQADKVVNKPSNMMSNVVAA